MTEFVNTLKPSGGHYSVIQDWIDDLATTVGSPDWSAHPVVILNFANYGDSHGTGKTKPTVGSVWIGQTSGAVAVVLTESQDSSCLAIRTSGAAFVSGEPCVQYGVNDTLDLVGSPAACSGAVLECYDGDYGGVNGAYTQSTLIPDEIGNANTQIVIRAAAGQDHAGELDAGFKIRSVNECFHVEGKYVTLDRLQLKVTGGGQYAVELYAPQSVVLSRLLGQCQTDCGFIVMYGSLNQAEDDVIIDRCVGYDSPTWPVFNLGRGVTMRNCGAYGSATGISFINNCRIENCVAFGNGTDFAFSAANAGSGHNASGDMTAPGSASQTGLDNADFVDYPGDNFRPALTQQLAGNGADLSAHFTADIAGQDYVNWDIGPYVNASGTSSLSFDGPNIPDQQATGHDPYSFSVAGRWSSDDEPLTYSESPAGAAWPSWLSIDANSGILTGMVSDNAQIGTTAGLIVRVTDNLGAEADSNAFSMEAVKPAPASFNPSLPADVQVGLGAMVSLAYQMNAPAPPLAAVWQVDVDGLGSWETVDPATSDNPYEFTSVAGDDGDKYRFLYWDVYQQIVTTREATITVIAAAPVINASSPADQAVLQGNNAVFAVIVDDGTPPYNFQWYEVGVGVMPGETGDSLTIAGVAYPGDDERQFYCEVTDQFLNMSQSRTATLVVPSTPVDADPSKPADAATIPGQAVVFESDITNADGGLMYLWEYNDGVSGWLPMAGEDQATLTYTPSAPSEHGWQFRCLYGDGYEQTGYTREATLDVAVYAELERGVLTINGDYDLYLYVLGSPPAPSNIVADSTAQVQEAEQPALAQDYQVVVLGAEQTQAQDAVLLSLEHVYPDDSAQQQTMSEPDVWIELITPEHSEQEQSLDPGGVIPSYVPLVVVDSAEQSQSLEQAVFTQNYVLSVDDTEQAQLLSTATLTVAQAVAIHNTVQRQFADQAGFAFVVGLKLEGEIITYAALGGEIVTY